MFIDLTFRPKNRWAIIDGKRRRPGKGLSPPRENVNGVVRVIFQARRYVKAYLALTPSSFLKFMKNWY
jgi:hypothetical protein